MRKVPTKYLPFLVGNVHYLAPEAQLDWVHGLWRDIQIREIRAKFAKLKEKVANDPRFC